MLEVKSDYSMFRQKKDENYYRKQRSGNVFREFLEQVNGNFFFIVREIRNENKMLITEGINNHVKNNDRKNAMDCRINEKE